MKLKKQAIGSLAFLMAAGLLPFFVQAADPAKSVGEKNFEKTLAPGKVHEECHMLDAGVAVPHRFKAEAPLAFNIHYHKGDQVDYPVRVEDVSEIVAVFKPKLSEHFCWMWKNTAAMPVKIVGSIDATRQ